MSDIKQDILKKTCVRCSKTKEISCFDKEKRGKYGVRTLCKECRHELRSLKLTEKIDKPPKVVDGKKKCTACGIEKCLQEFGHTNKNKLGLQSRCKKCLSEEHRKYWEKNKDSIKVSDKKYREKNKEKRKITHKTWRDKTDYCKSEKFKEQCKKYAHSEKGKKYYREYNKEYSKTEKGREIYRNYRNKKRDTDPNFRMRDVLKGRIRDGLRAQSAKKLLKTEEYLGCSFDFLRKYLESLWTDGMNWDNYGYYGWHVDHIIPCARFNLTNPEQQKQCFHYTNLQPLWAKENLSKGAKLVA